MYNGIAPCKAPADPAGSGGVALMIVASDE